MFAAVEISYCYHVFENFIPIITSMAFDPLTNTWEEPVDGIKLPHEREKHNMISVGKRVYILGGRYDYMCFSLYIRGFDSESFSEKDEGAISSYNTKVKGDKSYCWDNNHPSLCNPRANAGTVMIGQNIYILGGKSYQRDCDVLPIECYNTRRRKVRESFVLPEANSYGSVDCVKLKVPTCNKDLNFSDILLYDKWVMW
ncbi:hypothetical protein KUTeg_014029 [Tegillarca granosa]|uniref:Uncharacterized protein n=1 Tax=Tegillarca granosa TaxID=220873 RepID=A0ABQ9EVE4_TEGGR|nr:hypothetical protein KUTeg_014029 [Tegillarca granosa]